MSIFIRIWFFFGLIILLGLWFMSYTFNQQVKTQCSTGRRRYPCGKCQYYRDVSS